MDLLQPRLMATIVDEGVLGLSHNGVGDLELVLTTGLRMILTVILGAFCGVMSGVFANICSQNFGNDLRKDAFSRIMSLSFEQMDQFSTGSLITRVTNDVTQVQNLLSQMIRGFVRTFLLFAGGIVSMLMLDMSFGIVVACALPFIVAIAVYFMTKANPMFGKLQKKLDRLNNVIQENVTGSRVVKAYVKEEYEEERFRKANGELVDTQLRVLTLFAYMTPLMNIVLNVSIVAIIKLGAIEVEAGAASPGDVMAAITYLSQILSAVMRMTMIFQSVSRGMASGKRIMEVIDCEPTIVGGSCQGGKGTKGKVEFRNVSFAYPDANEEMVLSDINLTIEPGETIGILGTTGCGKSSLVNLIPRFYDTTKGCVLVDGVDVREYDLKVLRNKVAIALQKSEIFSTTIGDNIRWGNPDAAEEQVEKAAEIAQAMEFISKKSEGMDTMVAEKGMSLSGGQKQRVAISRAVLKDADVLIFDDTTSALDLRTEADLYAALDKEYGHVTKIIIAQRIASVKNADRIAILDNGRIAACDTHENLLKYSEIYQDIYESQLKREVRIMSNEKKPEVQLNHYKVPGARGPRNRQEVEKPKDGKKTLLKLLRYFAAEKFMLIGLLAAVCVLVVCTVLAPSVQSNAIDRITEGSFEQLPGILLILLVIYGIHCLCTLVQSIISARLSQKIVRRMREDLFHKIVNLPIKYIDTHSHGDIMSRMTNDVENISNTISQSLSSLVSGMLTIVGTVIMMVYYCWQLALLSCITVILTIIATKYLSAAMRKFFRERQVLLGSLNGTVEEMVTGYKTVVAYNRQEEIIAEFDRTADALTKTGIQAEILGGSMGPVMNCINNISFVIIAAFGGYFAINGMISIGVISAFIVYAKQFGRPIDELAQVYGQIQTAIAGAERVFEIMDEHAEDKSGSRDVKDMEGVITFEHVNFSYVEGKPVIKDFSLKVGAGQKIALVGSTGSGKTTIVNLLMRFYNIDSGRIMIDGVDIRDIDCNELRSNTAIVLQDTVLFTDTVRNNLKYSKPDAADEEMENAARMSHCHKMIRQLKKGYDTVLTGGGSGISQGQRQLLAIARAFLADPKILILDEATSSVDTRTEKHIQDAMLKLMRNRTSLIIAHRISTIQDADCIVVMDAGHIAEMGDHEELMEKKGKYYELYMTQFAGNAT